jgi:hypothetical protein
LLSTADQRGAKRKKYSLLGSQEVYLGTKNKADKSAMQVAPLQILTRATHARKLLPAAWASVPFEFEFCFSIVGGV